MFRNMFQNLRFTTNKKGESENPDSPFLTPIIYRVLKCAISFAKFRV